MKIDIIGGLGDDGSPSIIEKWAEHSVVLGDIASTMENDKTQKPKKALKPNTFGDKVLYINAAFAHKYADMTYNAVQKARIASKKGLNNHANRIIAFLEKTIGMGTTPDRVVMVPEKKKENRDLDNIDDIYIGEAMNRMPEEFDPDSGVMGEMRLNQDPRNPNHWNWTDQYRIEDVAETGDLGEIDELDGAWLPQPLDNALHTAWDLYPAGMAYNMATGHWKPSQQYEALTHVPQAITTAAQYTPAGTIYNAATGNMQAYTTAPPPPSNQTGNDGVKDEENKTKQYLKYGVLALGVVAGIGIVYYLVKKR